MTCTDTESVTHSLSHSVTHFHLPIYRYQSVMNSLRTAMKITRSIADSFSHSSAISDALTHSHLWSHSVTRTLIHGSAAQSPLPLATTQVSYINRFQHQGVSRTLFPDVREFSYKKSKAIPLVGSGGPTGL
jgi:hypothetical protein